MSKSDVKDVPKMDGAPTVEMTAPYTILLATCIYVMLVRNIGGHLVALLQKLFTLVLLHPGNIAPDRMRNLSQKKVNPEKSL